jgi:phasin family protein
MSNHNNPFEFFQSFMNQESFAKSMQGMPNIDMSSFSNTMKNTAETLSSTGQMVSENMQSIFKRGADALQKNTTEMYNTMKDAVSAGDINQINTCQQKYLQSTMDTNFNNAKEVIDMSTKSLLEVLSVMQNSLKENTGKAFTTPKHK